MTKKIPLSGLTHSLALVVAGMIPITFFPLTLEPAIQPKMFLLFWLGLLAVALWSVRVVWQRRVVVSVSTLSLSVLILLATNVLSAFAAINPWQQVSGRFLLTAGMCLGVFFGTQAFPKLRWSSLLPTWLLTTLPLNLLFWWQLSPWPLSRSLNRWLSTTYPENPLFSLTESPLTFAMFALPLLLASLPWFVQESKKWPQWQKWLWSGLITLNLVTLLGLGWQLWHNQAWRPALLPMGVGWAIAVENFKSLRTFFVGVGPEHFLSAFHQNRPVSFNLHPLWNLRFQVSSTEALQAITTTGVFSFIAWVGVFASALLSLRFLPWKEHAPLWILLGSATAWFFLFPWGASSYGVFTLLLIALVNEVRRVFPESVKDVIFLLSAVRIVDSGTVKTTPVHRGFTWGVAGITGILVVLALYFSGRVFAAHMAFFRSLQEAQKGNSQALYDYQLQAVRLHPYWTPFRRNFANTNLVLATSLLQQGELSEEQKQTFAKLLSQAIKEGRLTGQINRTETENWENLANIYANMLQVEGGPDWALLSIAQAIQTDPIAPQMRLQMGNIYMQLDNPDQAIKLYEQAIQLKPDWHTSFYRYGAALELKQQPGIALQAYKKSLSLIDSTHQDYAAIQDAILRVEPLANKQEGSSLKEQPPGISVPEIPTRPDIPTTQSPENTPSPDQVLQTTPTEINGSNTPNPENIVLPVIE